MSNACLTICAIDSLRFLIYNLFYKLSREKSKKIFWKKNRCRWKRLKERIEIQGGRSVTKYFIDK